jgi:hypothetical protein
LIEDLGRRPLQVRHPAIRALTAPALKGVILDFENENKSGGGYAGT